MRNRICVIVPLWLITKWWTADRDGEKSLLHKCRCEDILSEA